MFRKLKSVVAFLKIITTVVLSRPLRPKPMKKYTCKKGV